MTSSSSASPPAAAIPEIRPFRSGDRAAVIDLWRACDLASLNSTPERDIELCLASPHARLLVAAFGSAVVATAMVGYDGNRGWLHRVAVDRAYRRRGIARLLIAQAEAWVAGRGVPKLNLQIRADHARAQDLWEKLGYAVEPRISMGKLLPPLPPHAAAAGAPPGQLKVTVTYLEMRQRLRTPAPPAPPRKLAVLRADEISVPFYRYLYNTIGAPWLWYERRRLSDEALAAIVRDAGVDVFVLYASGEPAGYAELDRRRMPDIEIAYFGLMPNWVGRGLGAFFLRWAIDAAWQHNPARLWVHTCNLDHPKAIAVYQRTGFTPYRQETKLIDDPRPLL